MKERNFSPGFRLSTIDVLILVAGVIGAFLLAQHGWWWLAIIIGWVLGHFFLFCNVFRMSRRPELIWGFVLIVLGANALFGDTHDLIVAVVGSLLLTVVLVVIEMRRPYYHGIGWSKVNPNLKTWWDAQR